MELLRQQETLQLAFAGQPLLLQQFVQQQQEATQHLHHNHQQPQAQAQAQAQAPQPTNQQRLIQERLSALRKKEADRLAASAHSRPPHPSTPAHATAQPDFGAALRTAAPGVSSSPFGSYSCSSSSSSSSSVFPPASSLNSFISSSAPSPAPAPSSRPRKFDGLASQVNFVVR
ncbi:hypothetical protein IFR04_004472 [Cadophora malorum]|uniref:Uncharacterized protein n=1 Tax=Cadophora malorum TaxID=108018 RepID=A0A8H7WCW4_9HELO|nr:hypothetical protein IFR04_004472 [Cadophora malorum]